MLLLTDDGALQARIANPRHELAKIYWAQVENVPTEDALAALRRGVDLGDFVTRPAGARLIDEPANLWPRDPPIRYRAKIPTAWLEITLREGKNRQVRRMTARVGFPTLRLVRAAIGRVAARRSRAGRVARDRRGRDTVRLDMLPNLSNVLPDVRDGITREERVVLWVLHETQKERGGRSVPDDDALGPRLRALLYQSRGSVRDAREVGRAQALNCGGCNARKVGGLNRGGAMR